MHYVPFPIETVPTAKSQWFARGAINILCVGKFQRRKNHILLLRALAPLQKRYGLRLTVVGERSTDEHDAEYRRVVRFVEEQAFADWVHLRTNVPFREMLDLYAEHDLFVLPSSREQVGVSVLEAMARGLPVVCSNTSGARSYVRTGENGYVFVSDDVDDLRGAIEDAVSDRERLMAMGAASLELAGSVHAPRPYYTGLMSIVADVAPRQMQAWLSNK